ncbi:MAG TPA: type II secretion system protein [Terriglobia bacterium]|nr:type II secretion system protein [Terriglobia bacterium]
MSRNRRPEAAATTALSGVDARQRPPYQIDGQRSARGFTLLELMFVMAIILILASFALPTYTTIMQRAREAVLRQDLQTMRQLIDEYTVDKQQPPQELQDLVDAGYLRGGIPADPMTGSNDSWKVDVEQVPTAPDASSTGIVDVHSGADGTSLAGTPYSEW